MTLLRVACILAMAAGLAGCVSYTPTDNVTVSGPCAPNLVRVGLHF